MLVRVATSWLAAPILGVLACAASGHALMASDMEFSCSVAAGVSQDQADLICTEFAEFLRETYPERKFHPGSGTYPQLALTVVLATDRSVALAVDWIDADGRKTAGTPLQTSFFDRNSDPVLRRRFFVKFMNHNPVPF